MLAVLLKKRGLQIKIDQKNRRIMSFQQIPLALKWPEQLTFQNFVSGQNAQLLAHLSAIARGEEEFCTYLYTLNEGVGVTHLLQASCHAVTQRGNAAAYLSFKQTNFSPEIFEGMESLSLLCLDDIEQIAGQRKWEEALFNLYHRLQDENVRFLVAGHGLPKLLKWSLPDLQSRLAQAVIFQVQSLSDEEKIIVLKQRAGVRGLALSKEVGQYLLSRFPRDMRVLIETLNVIDKAALSAQRRLTVPFIKAVFESV